MPAPPRPQRSMTPAWAGGAALGLWGGSVTTPPWRLHWGLPVRVGAGQGSRAKGLLSQLWPGEGLRPASDGHLHPSSP